MKGKMKKYYKREKNMDVNLDFLEKIREYRKAHREESRFLEYFYHACEDYVEAVNSDGQGEKSKKELLECALVEAKKSLEVSDDYSPLYNPQSLISAIEQEMSNLDGGKNE